MDLYERIKALNSPSRKEREFEPHHRSLSTQTMTNNWHNRKIDNLVSTDRITNIIYKNKEKDSKKDDFKNKDFRPLVTDNKDCIEIVQQNNDTEKQDKKANIVVESMQKKKLDIMDKEKEDNEKRIKKRLSRRFFKRNSKYGKKHRPRQNK
ncbi:hypothetical protein SO802_015100 [Lithocarpus litseifolius]|uniref:Uncharacterized protein n=1 Tax=Lithocarpus litseifolius TaxID=425828 RepID=A0AAW2CTD7_9ROSI